MKQQSQNPHDISDSVSGDRSVKPFESCFNLFLSTRLRKSLNFQLVS